MAEVINQFHFLRPLWLLALLPAAVLCALLWHRQKRADQWSRIIPTQFMRYLIDGQQVRKKRWPLLALLLLWVLTTLALAGPAWQKIPQPVEQKTSALVICWDLSPSMLAEDIKPSRLVRSRLKLIDLLKARREGQTAVVAYSAEAYTVTPLTDDTRTIINLLPALSPTTLPSVGSNPEMAFDMAEQLLKDAGAGRGDILFLTDKIPSDALAYIRDMALDSPYQLTIWGVGTTEGAPIPLPGGGFAKQPDGEMVIPQLNESELQEFAASNAAYYVPFVKNDSDVQTLLQLIDRNPRDTEKTQQLFDRWLDHGQYLVLALLPFVALAFRRGFIFALLVVPLFAYSPTVRAFSWSDLWLNRDQRAEKRLERGDAGAAGAFTSPQRRGSAYYQQDQYTEAAREFEQSPGAEGHYNRGTALTRAGQYERAIEAFERALAERPDFKKARENKRIAQQLAELQQQQENQQQQSPKGQQGEQNQRGQNRQDTEQSSGNQPRGEQQASNGQQQGQQQTPSQGQQNSSQRNSGQSNADQPRSSDQQDNPYAKAAEDKAQRQEQQSRMARQQRSDHEPDESERQRALSAAQADASQGQTEEEQMLEQMLRKVPDDPSGLLRNKFKYQYMQRKQSMDNQVPFSRNDPENRW